MAQTKARPFTGTDSWLSRQGLIRHLRWGYLALALFMVGDGIELGFLAVYLESRGITGGEVATIFTVYGFVVAGAAWLSGALAEAWGPRQLMLLGAAIWVVFEVAFLTAGVAADNYEVMLVVYAIRGLGYPFFAYGFLVWIIQDTPAEVACRAVGWFWFALSAGLGVISSFLAGAIIPVIGELSAMWLSLVFVVAGALIILLLVEHHRPAHRGDAESKLRSAARAVTVVADHPKVGIGGIVRTINTIAVYAIPAFFATHMVNDVGFSLSQWQSIWGSILIASMLGNVIFGYLGDRIGHLRVVSLFGGVGAAVSMLAMFYAPEHFGANLAVSVVTAAMLGLAMSAYVPLSVVVPQLAPAQTAAAVAVLNLGAGLSNAVGPGLATLFLGPLGVGGLVWLIVGIYLVGAALTVTLRPRNELQVAG